MVLSFLLRAMQHIIKNRVNRFKEQKANDDIADTLNDRKWDSGYPIGKGRSRSADKEIRNRT